MQDVTLVGRLRGNPIQMGEKVYFKLDAGANLPIPCFCKDATGRNMMKYLKNDDEISVEGKLHMMRFKGDKTHSLLVFARHISYGRKKKSLVPGG
jgi:hypothetical protein